MGKKTPRRVGMALGACVLLAAAAVGCMHFGSARVPSAAPVEAPAAAIDVIQPSQRVLLDDTVDRALAWMATQQNRDGSFRGLKACEPGITGLAVMAFLSRGHVPGEGPYGEVIDRGISFVMGCQKKNGLVSYEEPVYNSANWNLSAAHAASYSHAIGSLMLAEVYGMTERHDPEKLGGIIEKAVDFTRKLQTSRKRRPNDEGGWRYVVQRSDIDSDLSATSWHLMFLRSAKNAGFDVPSQFVDEAMQYVKDCFDPRRGTFIYGPDMPQRPPSRAMAGAGILALSLGGLHDTEMARRAGDWLLRNPHPPLGGDRTWLGMHYYYAMFLCSQGMLQLGGRYWEGYYPYVLNRLLAEQRPKGYWPGGLGSEKPLGDVYPTSMAVLALTAPYQVFPIFQR